MKQFVVELYYSELHLSQLIKTFKLPAYHIIKVHEDYYTEGHKQIHIL